ncbi:MAG: phospholipase D-like domain-containing protein [Candidatus Kryptoniota bacterium]
MKFAPTIILVSLLSASAWGQIAAWNITSSGTTAATITDANLTASSITVAPTTSISYQTSPGDMYCGSWSTSATFSTAGKYWQFSITPNHGFEVTISSLTFKSGCTSTGPHKLQVQYSLDGFATAKTALEESANTNTSSLTQFSLDTLPPATSSTITFRIWGYGASSTGNFRLNNIIIGGNLVPNGVVSSGIGSAQVSPTTITAKQTSDFTIKIASDEEDTIANIVVIVPTAFTWSMNPSDVSLASNSFSNANAMVNNDTINITGADVTEIDTGQVVIHSVAVPDSTMTGNFLVETASNDVLPSPVNSQLAVSVIKMVRIIDLHINDSLGVPIAPYQIGAVVTVSGIVTADFSTLPQTSLFIQDATAGVNIFSYSHSYNYQIGDSITFTGAIDQFRGGIEIVPDSSKTIIHSHGNSLPEPMLLTCADVNQTFNEDYTEPNEGRLVRVNGVTYNSVNTTITDVTGTTGGYVPTNLIPPTGTFDMIGILKQYKPGSTSTMTPPYTSDYEVEARTQSDIITSAGPAFISAPTETNIQPNSVTIDFKTGDLSTAVVKYGANSAYKDSVVVTTSDTTHDITLNGLSPATVYHYQVSATSTSGTNQTGDAIFSTASPSGTSGAMNVYFNKSVDTSVAKGEIAQTVDIAGKFLARVNAAKYSIDLALYSFSGTVGSNIANALLSAKSRGVKIRMIVENDNAGTAPMTTMRNNVPFITDTYDPVDDGTGLMHNKFAIFDFRDTSSFTDDWVWTGSWNATDPGDNDDAQNSIEIQDKALANAYTMEFNEMWGSSTGIPDSTQSRFGFDKSDTTPHKFNINGTPVELYFSPSDQTTLHIYQTLAIATSSINICMLTFTRSDLAQELVLKKAAGDKVRVVMDNNTDSGNQFSFLQTNGIDVHLKGSALGTGLLHHKYAVIDADNPKADDIVITGSHNWSTSAETMNDENTLIIHSARIANLYLQEFKARYIEAGGSDNILGVRQIGNNIPKSFGLSQNYPNPFNPSTVISYQLAAASHVTLKIYDVLGREVATLVDQKQNAGYYSFSFDASKFASGVYFCRIQAQNQDGSGKFTSVKKLLYMK